MARKALQNDAPLSEANNGKIMEAISDLLETHTEEINEAINDSEGRCITINFAVDVDASDSAPSIDVKCRFTPKTVTDKRTLQCDDPAQGKLLIYTPEELKKKEEKEEKEIEKAEKAQAKAEAAAKKAADKAAKAAKASGETYKPTDAL